MTVTGNDPIRRVLVLRGSPDREVARLAGAVADELRANGLRADVATPAEVDGLGGYDGVVMGSTLRWRHWHPAAVRFLRRHAAVLRVRPLWLFQVIGTTTSQPPAPSPDWTPTGPRQRFLDGPAPVSFDPHTAGPSSVRRWARTVAEPLVHHPTPVAPAPREPVAVGAEPSSDGG